MDSQKNYRVLNYTPNFVGVAARNRSVGLNPCEDGVPTFDYFSLEDIEYINSTSAAFRTGLLEFEEKDREALYQRLSIPDWKDRCIFERDIQDMLVHPTIDGLKKIIAITDVGTIERIRGNMEILKRYGVPISTKVEEVVNGRFRELNHGTRISRIVVSPKAEEPNPEMESLRGEVAELKEMLAMAMQQNKPAEEPKPVEPEPVEEAKKETPAPKTRKTSTRKKTVSK